MQPDQGRTQQEVLERRAQTTYSQDFEESAWLVQPAQDISGKEDLGGEGTQDCRRYGDRNIQRGSIQLGVPGGECIQIKGGCYDLDVRVLHNLHLENLMSNVMISR